MQLLFVSVQREGLRGSGLREGAAARVAQAQLVRHLLHGQQAPVQLLPGVGRRQAETYARHVERRGGEADADGGDAGAREALHRGRHLAERVHQHGHHRRVVVPERHHAQLAQPAGTADRPISIS